MLWIWKRLKFVIWETVKVAQVIEFIFENVENIGEKAENDGYKHCLLFPQCFLKPFMSWSKISISCKNLFLNRCKINMFNPFSRRQILDSSKLKEFADDNFKF